MIINTVATIKRLENGKAELIIYKNKQVIFSKVYNTFRNAKIARTVLMKKYF